MLAEIQEKFHQKQCDSDYNCQRWISTKTEHELDKPRSMEHRMENSSMLRPMKYWKEQKKATKAGENNAKKD